MTVIPTFRFHDAKTAIRFLVDGLGFTEHLVVPGEDDRIEHAQLTRGDGMVMLGSREVGGWDLGPTSVYIVVEDAATVGAIYESALATGATSVMPPTPEDYGGSNATVRDAEGNFWSIGDYKP